MTLIAALICQGCVLIGSDSKVEDDLGTYKQEKLYRFLDSQLVWGGSGDGRIIEDINSWITSQKSFSALDTIIQDKKPQIHGVWIELLANQLASFNGRNLKRVVEVTKQQSLEASSVTGELLVAGFLDNKPFLLTINRQGTPSYDTKHGFAASGSECNRFVGALQAIMPDNLLTLSFKDVVISFAKALDASIKNSGKADFPVQMWVAYPDSVKQILNLEDGNKPTLDRLESFLNHA